MSVTATIDGVSVDIREGESILEAARRCGADVPTLCYDSRVDPSASCRMCVVKVDGRRLPVASCAHALQADMNVTTSDDELEENRKTILKLVLSENPTEECRSCIERGPCELHSLATDYGVESDYYDGAISGRSPEDTTPIARDPLAGHLWLPLHAVCSVEQAHAIIPEGPRIRHTTSSRPSTRACLRANLHFSASAFRRAPRRAIPRMLGKAGSADVTKVVLICPSAHRLRHRAHVAKGEYPVTPDWDAPAAPARCASRAVGIGLLSEPRPPHDALVRRDGRLQPASWTRPSPSPATTLQTVRAPRPAPATFALWSSAAPRPRALLSRSWRAPSLGTNNIDNCSRT